jgi:uncharacterized protein
MNRDVHETLQYACRRHENVDGAERGLAQPDGRGERLFFQDIAIRREAAGFPGEALEPGGIPVQSRDACVCSMKRQGDGAPDAACGPGYQGDFAIKVDLHVTLGKRDGYGRDGGEAMDGGNKLVKEPAKLQPGELRPAIVVTGASSGIGRALAIQAGTDRHVLLVARSVEPMRLIAADILAKGGSASVLQLDITDPLAAQTIAARLGDGSHYCDILVNNAGYGLIGKAGELDAAEQLGIIDLNIRALAALSLAFLPGMLERGRGGILNVASVAAFAPGPGMAMYYASKAFVRSFSLALWQEAKGSGVTVTALCPGPVSTGFFSRATGGVKKKPSLFKLLPGTTAEQVADAGWKAFRAGRRLVIPGWTNWLTVRVVQILPDPLTLWLIARLQAARKRMT